MAEEAFEASPAAEFGSAEDFLGAIAELTGAAGGGAAGGAEPGGPVINDPFSSAGAPGGLDAADYAADPDGRSANNPFGPNDLPEGFGNE